MPTIVRSIRKKDNNPIIRRKKMEISETSLLPPNREYLQLTIAQVTATYKTAGGKNATLTMERISEQSFTVTEGDSGVRWNNKRRCRRYPMEQWDAFYASCIRKGWLLYDTEYRGKIEVRTSGRMQPIADADAAELVERLMTFANQMIEEQYAKAVWDVPDTAFEKARNCLDELALCYETMENADFNERLTYLFAVLPRRIDVLAKYIAPKDATAEDRARIVETERERLDVLYTMLRGGNASGMQGKETLLEVYGLEIRRMNAEEEAYAKSLLKEQKEKFLQGWRIVNKRTELAFQTFCEREKLTPEKGIDLLFHGSRHENWWSILTNGLTINPVGVIITGKAYGQGTYFAPDARKSLGYTSRAGAKWTGGGEDTGFMALYQVATGKRYDGRQGCDARLDWQKLQNICPGAHCTWAECRYSGFLMDEVIVYRDEQSTIWGLLELSM